MKAGKMTAAQHEALARCTDEEYPFLPVRREAKKYERLMARGLLRIHTLSGDGWQRAGYVVTDAGRAALAEMEGK